MTISRTSPGHQPKTTPPGQAPTAPNPSLVLLLQQKISHKIIHHINTNTIPVCQEFFRAKFPSGKEISKQPFPSRPIRGLTRYTDRHTHTHTIQPLQRDGADLFQVERPLSDSIQGCPYRFWHGGMVPP